MKRSISVLGLVIALPLAACSEDVESPLGVQPLDSTLEVPSDRENAAPRPGDESIGQLAVAAGFQELVGALAYVDAELDTGLVDLFTNGTDQFTVFAPTDEAFLNLYALLSSVLAADIDEITDVPATIVLDVLLYHVTDGRRAANSVVPKRGTRVIETLKGESFRVRPDLTIIDGLTGIRAEEDDAEITTANISASNGIIHIIDQVIVPPSVVFALTN